MTNTMANRNSNRGTLVGGAGAPALKEKTWWKIRRRRWLEIVGAAVIVMAILPKITVRVAKAFSPRMGRTGQQQVVQKLTQFLPTRAGTSACSNSATALLMTEESRSPPPTTFREAEILGLKLMQEGNYEEALSVFKKGLQLPGSRMDVLRKQSVPGPSPVGGSKGGTDSTTILELDEFELQAANYNMACASAQLGLLNEAVEYLRVAFENGFDNYSTVRGDPDIDPIKGTAGFDKLMEEYDPKKKGFNPFGFLGMS